MVWKNQKEIFGKLIFRVWKIEFLIGWKVYYYQEKFEDEKYHDYDWRL